MSGSPKYTRAQLEERMRQALEAERHRKAEEERRRREEAAARERARCLEAARGRLQGRAAEVRATLRRRQGELYPQDLQRLQQDLADLEGQVGSACTEGALTRPAREVEALLARAAEAAARRRREEEEGRRRQELDRLSWEVNEAERRLRDIDPEHGRKFDTGGQQLARQALEGARQAVAREDLPAVRTEVPRARQAVEGHGARVREARDRWHAEREAARATLGQAEAMLAGLSEDRVTMRWQASRVQEFRATLESLQGRFQTEAFDDVQAGVRGLLQVEPGLVEEANQAQLQADQRDAIAKAVQQALERMGFFVSAPRAEHPDHPATALLLEARSAAGKALGVSVPVDGEIWYDIEGYPMSTSPIPGGGTARNCDEAEAVLLDLHRVLGEAYGVQASELMWEGKDPDRKLRKADELPTSGQTRERRLLR